MQIIEFFFFSQAKGRSRNCRSAKPGNKDRGKITITPATQRDTKNTGLSANRLRLFPATTRNGRRGRGKGGGVGSQINIHDYGDGGEQEGREGEKGRRGEKGAHGKTNKRGLTGWSDGRHDEGPAGGTRVCRLKGCGRRPATRRSRRGGTRPSQVGAASAYGLDGSVTGLVLRGNAVSIYMPCPGIDNMILSAATSEAHPG